MVIWPIGTKFVVRTGEGLESFAIVDDAPDPDRGRIALSSRFGKFLTRALPGETFRYGGANWEEVYQVVEVAAVPGKPRGFASTLRIISGKVKNGQPLTPEERSSLAEHGQGPLLEAVKKRDDERRLAGILTKISAGRFLDKSEKGWLKENNQFEILATYYDKQYAKTLNLTCAAGAGSSWRKAGNPNRALSSTENTSESLGPPRHVAMVLTCRGGAYRDLGYLGMADECGQRALALHPTSPHAYRLLGAVAYQNGSLEEGDEYFSIARMLSSSTQSHMDDLVDELAGVLAVSSQRVRNRILDHLRREKPRTYARLVKLRWARPSGDRTETNSTKEVGL